MPNGRWVFPLDPDCPVVEKHRRAHDEDPMNEIYGEFVAEAYAEWEPKHRGECKRCQEYGAANVDVDYGYG